MSNYKQKNQRKVNTIAELKKENNELRKQLDNVINYAKSLDSKNTELSIKRLSLMMDFYDKIEEKEIKEKYITEINEILFPSEIHLEEDVNEETKEEVKEEIKK